jgi:hypothetical protein
VLPALVDVGGTVWPERLAAQVNSNDCVEQMTVAAGVDAVHACETLRRALGEDDGSLVQDKHGLLSAVRLA